MTVACAGDARADRGRDVLAHVELQRDRAGCDRRGQAGELAARHVDVFDGGSDDVASTGPQHALRASGDLCALTSPCGRDASGFIAVALGVLALSADSAVAAPFEVGAAVGDYTPPPFGAIANDPANCLPADPGIYTGPRAFSFMEPYSDQNGNGHYDSASRSSTATRTSAGTATSSAAAPTRRASTRTCSIRSLRGRSWSRTGHKTVAVEVLDHEGLFNVYMDRIRAKVAADGYALDDVFISSTHDESAPDSLGLYGVERRPTSSVNDYWNDYLVDKSAKAIEDAYDQHAAGARSATRSPQEPQNMRQCWSSYPFVDNMRMPVLQAVDCERKRDRHARKRQPARRDARLQPRPEREDLRSAPTGRTSSGPARAALGRRRDRDGRRGRKRGESAGLLGAGLGHAGAVHRRRPSRRLPHALQPERHDAAARLRRGDAGSSASSSRSGPAGARLGARHRSRTRSGARAATSASRSRNALFAAGAARASSPSDPAYTDNCTVEVPPAPNGRPAGTRSRARWRRSRSATASSSRCPARCSRFTYCAASSDPTTCRSRSTRCRRGRCRTCTRPTASTTGSART